MSTPFEASSVPLQPPPSTCTKTNRQLPLSIGELHKLSEEDRIVQIIERSNFFGLYFGRTLEVNRKQYLKALEHANRVKHTGDDLVFPTKDVEIGFPKLHSNNVDMRQHDSQEPSPQNLLALTYIEKAKQGHTCQQLRKAIESLPAGYPKIDKIVAFSDLSYPLPKHADRITSQRSYAHIASLLTLRDIIGSAQDFQGDIPIYLQGLMSTGSSKADNNMAVEDFNIQIVDGGIGYQTAFTLISSSTLVVNLTLDHLDLVDSIPDQIFEICTPAAYLAPVLEKSTQVEGYLLDQRTAAGCGVTVWDLSEKKILLPGLYYNPSNLRKTLSNKYTKTQIDLGDAQYDGVVVDASCGMVFGRDGWMDVEPGSSRLDKVSWIGYEPTLYIRKD